MPRTRTITDSALVDAALSLLTDAGPQGFTLAALGARVGLSPSTLLQRFGSRAELLAQAIARSTARLQAPPPPGQAASRAELIAWLVGMTAGMDTRPQLAGQVALLMEDLRDAEGTRGTLARRHVLALRQALSSRLQALGVRQPEQAARMVEAHWHGLVLQWGLGGTGSLRRWMAAGLADVLDLLGVEPE